MEEDLKKIVKKERKRFSKRRRMIRKEVKEELLRLVEKKVSSFYEYLARWCGGSKKKGKEGEAEKRERVP